MLNLPLIHNTKIKGGFLSGTCTVSNYTIYGTVELYEDRHDSVFVKFNDEDNTEMTIPKTAENSATLAFLAAYATGDTSSIQTVSIYGLSQSR
ncbi:MAG: hypothetical protein ACRCXZ_02495 [Patescibacteria group bacterium]